jgi:hypothetical protein
MMLLQSFPQLLPVEEPVSDDEGGYPHRVSESESESEQDIYIIIFLVHIRGNKLFR